MQVTVKVSVKQVLSYRCKLRQVLGEGEHLILWEPSQRFHRQSIVCGGAQGSWWHSVRRAATRTAEWGPTEWNLQKPDPHYYLCGTWKACEGFKLKRYVKLF